MQRERLVHRLQRRARSRPARGRRPRGTTRASASTGCSVILRGGPAPARPWLPTSDLGDERQDVDPDRPADGPPAGASTASTQTGPSANQPPASVRQRVAAVARRGHADGRAGSRRPPARGRAAAERGRASGRTRAARASRSRARSRTRSADTTAYRPTRKAIRSGSATGSQGTTSRVATAATTKAAATTRSRTARAVEQRLRGAPGQPPPVQRKHPLVAHSARAYRCPSKFTRVLRTIRPPEPPRPDGAFAP